VISRLVLTLWFAGLSAELLADEAIDAAAPGRRAEIAAQAPARAGSTFSVAKPRMEKRAQPKKGERK
jgi:hypothetical protein